ncbi:MAG TPA: TolC family protein [Gammaproteobacteria bacterium]|nr:TolC family protein [Gammaproteobacteria bacterium]
MSTLPFSSVYAQTLTPAPPPPAAILYKPQPADANAILTLRDAILLAMRFNPNVKNAELQRVVDKFSLAVARDQFAPQVSLTGQALFQNGAAPSYSGFPTVNYLTPYGTQIKTGLTQVIDSDNAAAFTTDATVSITQPLLRGFGKRVTQANLYSAQDTEKINQLNFKNSVMTQVVGVINAYYQLVQAYNSLEVNNLSLRDEENTLNQTQAKIKVGKAAPTEQIQQQLNIANSQLNISQNQNAVLQSYQNLLSLLGLDPNAHINIDKKINYPNKALPSLNECIDTALAHNISYQSALFAYKITERGVIVAQDQQKWQLNATGTLMQPITPTGGSTGISSKSLTLDLDIPIHDVARQQQLVSAKVALSQAKVNLTQQKYALITNVTNAYHTVQYNQRQVQLSENTVKLAQQSLNIAKIKFNYGKTTSFELTSLQSALTNAQIGFIGQRIQYINAVEALFQILGTTLQRWDINLTY